MNICIESFSGKCIRPYITDLARLRMDIFRDFPYLYEGSIAYEENYLETYLRSDETIIVVVKDGDRVVGASSGLPLNMETDEVLEAFNGSGIRPEEVFYFGESLLMKAYRGQGIGHAFFDERERHARALERFNYTAFFAVQRPENHPLRPKNYKPLDTFWRKRGYEPRPDMISHYSWQDIDLPEETKKPMMFWIKSWFNAA